MYNGLPILFNIGKFQKGVSILISPWKWTKKLSTIFWTWKQCYECCRDIFKYIPHLQVILAKMENCQNGTFEPVHEIWKMFWPKAFFWSIMKMAIRKFFHNISQGLPNPGFMQEKVQKGDFLWCPMMKKIFNPFFRFYTSRVHGFC